MTHEEVRDRAEAFVLGALPADEHDALLAHLRACAECTAYVRALEPVIDALAASVPQIEPPAGLRERLRRAIERERSEGECEM